MQEAGGREGGGGCKDYMSNWLPGSVSSQNYTNDFWVRRSPCPGRTKVDPRSRINEPPRTPSSSGRRGFGAIWLKWRHIDLNPEAQTRRRDTTSGPESRSQSEGEKRGRSSQRKRPERQLLWSGDSTLPQAKEAFAPPPHGSLCQRSAELSRVTCLSRSHLSQINLGLISLDLDLKPLNFSLLILTFLAAVLALAANCCWL